MSSTTKVIILFLLPISCLAQIKFEDGYYIDLENKRIECLIENHDWKNNPRDFRYKLTENDVTKKATVSSVKEFGITSQSRYVAADIKIDRTGDRLEELSNDKNPVWLRERLFLNVLVESKISLLVYVDGNLKRYFYAKGDTVKQLIHKMYLLEDGQAKANDAFHQQLRAEVKCGTITDIELKKVDYSKSDLIKYFKSYSVCSGDETKDFTEFAAKKRKSSFHIKLTPGITYSSVDVAYGQNTTYRNEDVHFDNQVGFRIGAELEWILPYNKNKWGIVLEPSYQSYSATNPSIPSSVATLNMLEFPAGLRYYIFLGEKSRIFINGYYVFSVPGESSIDIRGHVYEVSNSNKFAVGTGFDFRRFSGEVRYYGSGDILNDYLFWTAKYGSLSFILGYRLF